MNQDYYSTQELVRRLNENEDIQTEVLDKPIKKHIRPYQKIIFWSIVTLAMLHLVFMVLPMISKPLFRDIFGYELSLVVLQNQELDGDVEATTCVVKSVNYDILTDGDHVIVYDLYQSGYYWEMDVIELQSQNEKIVLTFDGTISHTVDYQNIYGRSVRETGGIETIYYTAATPSGFVLMMFMHSMLVYITYYYIFKNDKKNSKDMAYETKD